MGCKKDADADILNSELSVAMLSAFRPAAAAEAVAAAA
jgi:hypothetical protein